MITAILAFISALPSIINGVTAFSNKYFDTKAQMVAARIGGDVNVLKAALTAAAIEQQTRVAGLQVLASSKVLLFLVVGFALPYMFYEWQCIVYDTIWMHGTTKTFPINEDFTAWGNTIITCLFGSGTAVTMNPHVFQSR